MSLRLVETALLTRAATALGSITCAYENAPFTKPNDAKWAAVFFLPNVPSVETLGSTGEDMVDGILQIDLNYPRATGADAGGDDYETIRDSFAAGLKLTSGGQAVTITNCGRSQGRLVDNFWRVSVTVTWYALIPR